MVAARRNYFRGRTSPGSRAKSHNNYPSKIERGVAARLPPPPRPKQNAHCRPRKMMSASQIAPPPPSRLIAATWRPPVPDT